LPVGTAECAGKDEVCLHWAAVSAITRPATYWHMLPEATQARKAIWDAINPHTGKRRIDEAFPHEIRASTREHEMMIKFVNGSTWQVVGSDNFNSLLGSPPAGVVFSEWSLANPSAWGYLRPILAENGGWALFIYTPRGKNHGYKTIQMAESEEGWFAERLTVEDTKALPKILLDTELKEYISEYGEDQGRSFYEQEYHVSFNAAIIGAVYGAAMTRAEKEGRIGPYEYDPTLPVNTAWDLGRSDSTVIIWWQQAKGEIRLIKCHDSNLNDPEYYCGLLYGKKIVIDARDNESGNITKWHLGDDIEGYEDCQKFTYGTHFVPHDAAIKLLQAAGRSIVQQFHDLGIETRVVSSTTDSNSHAAARTTIDRSWFNEKEQRLVEALKQYHYKWDEERKEISVKPVHDWSSHICFVGETKVLTRYGAYQIMNLPEHGEVLTLCGWKRYGNPRITRKNARLVEVMFTGGYTVKCTPDHLFLTESGWKSAESLVRNSEILSTLTRLRSISMVGYTAYGRMKYIFHGAVKSFIEPYGNLHLGLYLKNAISIIWIVILKTTGLTTLNAWMVANISSHPMQPIRRSLVSGCSQNQREKRLLNGTNLLREGYGINATPNEANHGQNGSVKNCTARNAVLNSMLWLGKAAIRKFTAQQSAVTLTIESVRHLSENDDVWCITVPDDSSFSLSNGAVVHNCDAYEIIGQVWKNNVEVKEVKKRIFLHEATANDIFWGEKTVKRRERI
jgi:phage terminase large subunit